MRFSRAHKAGMVIGFGMGGFVDGILLHMLLRWHHMLSNRIPPDTMAGLHTNMTGDGLFHAFTWIVTFIGLLMFWNAARLSAIGEEALPSTRGFLGSLVLGWGLFNLIEGIIDHHILRLHNVREVSDPTVWNIGFLLLGGVMLIGIGWSMMRVRDRRRVSAYV